MNWAAMGDRLAPLMTLVFALSLLVGIVIIWRARRTARTTGFGVVRDRANHRARQWMLWAAVLALLAGLSTGFWALSVWNPQALPTPAPTATPTLIPSPTPRPPTATPTATPPPTMTPTATPAPPSAASDLPAALRGPFPAQAVTPGPDAGLVDLILAAGQRNDEPINPSTHFPRGTERVYAFFALEGMARNVPWSHHWYGEVDGEFKELWGQVELWPYDLAGGRTWRYFNCRPGKYELHTYVGSQLQQKVPFVVQGD